MWRFRFPIRSTSSNQKRVFPSKYVRDAGSTEKVQLARQLLPKVIGTTSFILLS